MFRKKVLVLVTAFIHASISPIIAFELIDCQAKVRNLVQGKCYENVKMWLTFGKESAILVKN